MNRRIREAVVMVKSDPKRASVLGALLLVLVGMSARAYWKLGPAGVIARGTTSSAPGTDGAAPKADSAAAIRELARTAGVVVPEAMQKDLAPIIALTTPPPLNRDLFRLNAAVFPPPVPVATESRVAPKSQPEKADQSPRIPAPVPEIPLEERITRESQRLKVRSTLVGAHPLAVFEIAGERRTSMVLPGQSVAGFVLVKVTATGVVVEKEGVQIELQRVQ